MVQRLPQLGRRNATKCNGTVHKFSADDESFMGKKNVQQRGRSQQGLQMILLKHGFKQRTSVVTIGNQYINKRCKPSTAKHQHKTKYTLSATNLATLINNAVI